VNNLGRLKKLALSISGCGRITYLSLPPLGFTNKFGSGPGRFSERSAIFTQRAENV
jgi:hypothetical protein